jgi:hypothetical protein
MVFENDFEMKLQKTAARCKEGDSTGLIAIFRNAAGGKSKLREDVTLQK